jgi:proline dehydrogenase
MAGLATRILVKVLPLLPGFMIWPVAKRYIAGPTLRDALATTRELNDLGASTTLDLLGEESTDLSAAREVARRYVEVIEQVRGEGLDAGVSVKLTAFGVRRDPSACRDLVADVMGTAARHDVFVRIDMEDSSLTQTTLDMHRELRGEFPNTGVVLQAALKRTIDDAKTLAIEGVPVRLVKGIYVEPPKIAHTGFQEIREAFVSVLEILLEGRGRVGIATHDGYLVQQSRRVIRALETPADRYEFQMLLGVRRPLRDALVKDGLGMRVYVPFGEDWRAYSVRRMKENPDVAGHVIRALLPWNR